MNVGENSFARCRHRHLPRGFSQPILATAPGQVGQPFQSPAILKLETLADPVDHQRKPGRADHPDQLAVGHVGDGLWGGKSAIAASPGAKGSS